MNDDRPALRLVRAPPPAAGGLDARDDDVLMTLVAAGRREAYSALAARHLPALTRFCAKFAGGARQGEELALDALLEVWTRRQSYRAEGCFRVWLFTLARHRCLNHLRTERRRERWLAPAGAEEGRSGAQVPASPLQPDQIERLLATEQARQVRAAVLTLSPKLREAVLLRFDQELEYAEVARVVGAPETTVRSRVFLALKALRARLAPGEETP